MAPEVIFFEFYEGKSVDLFAVAIILFCLHAGHQPFERALPHDRWYNLIIEGNHDSFWQIAEEGQPKGFFSPEFKDLLNVMFKIDPAERLSLAEVVGHPWFKGQFASHEDVVTVLEQRSSAF